MTEPSLPIDPDDYADLLDSYNDPKIAQRGAYELAYYHAFGVLPEFTFVIERVEEYPAGRLIIHHDVYGGRQ